MEGKYGIGSEMSSLLKPLTLAVEEGVPFLDPLYPRVGCANGPYLSSCLGLRSPAPCEPAVAVASAHKHAHAAAYAAERHLSAQNYSKVVEPDVPPPFVGRKSLFWFTGQLLAYLVRPAPPLVRWLQHQRREWGWDETRKVVGLHVRRGDTCRDWKANAFVEGRLDKRKWRKCDQLDLYAPHVKALVQNYGLDAVYIATDDEDIVRQARANASELLGVAPSAVFSLPLNRTMYKRITIDAAMRTHDKINFDFAADAHGFVADLVLLAAADAHVGKSTSNMFRHALSLSNALKGGDCVAPYASLDSLWCANFGMNTGISLLNPKSMTVDIMTRPERRVNRQRRFDC